jgi:hypothetical protein
VAYIYLDIEYVKGVFMKTFVLKHWQRLLIFALVLILPLSALLVATNTTKASAQIINNQANYQTITDNRFDNLDLGTSFDESIFTEEEMQALNKVAQSVTNNLQVYAQELLQLVDKIENGDLKFDEQGQLLIDELQRVSIQQGGVYFDWSEVMEIATFCAYNGDKIGAAIDWIVGAVWVAIGWIPVVGQIIALGFQIWFYTNIFLLTIAFIDASYQRSGVLIFFELKYVWFVPVGVFIGHRIQ